MYNNVAEMGRYRAHVARMSPMSTRVFFSHYDIMG